MESNSCKRQKSEGGEGGIKPFNFFLNVDKKPQPEAFHPKFRQNLNLGDGGKKEGIRRRKQGNEEVIKTQ